MKKIISLLSVFVLAGITILTGGLLYQKRQSSVALNAPRSIPFAGTVETCEVFEVTFNIPEEELIAEASPSPSPSISPSLAPSTTASPTTAPTDSPVSYSCDSECDTDTECQTVDSKYVCHAASGTCRHINWPDENDCQPLPISSESPVASSTPPGTNTPSGSNIAQSTATPNPVTTSEPILPDAGVSLPTMLGTGFAALLIIAAFILAI